MNDTMPRQPAEPATVGVHPGRLRLLLERVREDVDQGPLPSAQVAVAKDGELVAFETYGDATPTTRYITQSAGRPLLAACAWKLMSDGLLDVDATVASVIPEFGENGKDGVTFRHVLTHTGGFPMAPIRFEAMTDRAARLAAMARLAARLGARHQDAIPPDVGRMGDRRRRRGRSPPCRCRSTSGRSSPHRWG